MKREQAIAVRVASALLIGIATAPVVRASPPPSLHVGGEEGACPAPGQVAAVLKRLLRRTLVTVAAGPLGPDDASIADQGAQFRVTVAGQERTFVDAARACDERAQNAAVFVAMVLDPPTIADLPVEAPVRPPVAPVVEPPRPPPARGESAPLGDLSLGGILLAAPEVANRRTAVAAGAVAWFRSQGRVQVGIGAGVLHGSLHFDGADADAWWIPIDVAVGFSAKFAAWELGAAIGPSASILSIVGQDLQQAHRQVRLEVGVHVSAMSRFWLSKNFALFLSADAVLRPVPYALRIDPQGEVGQTPSIWLGGAAGLSAAFE